MTLAGTNFTTNGSSITFVGGAGGITVTGLTVVDSAHITATFVIPGNAILGTRNVRVTTIGGGNSTTVPFTVLGATLTSISPASASRGTQVNVTLTGTGLTGATSVTVSGGGVTVSNFNAASDTSVTATFTIASNAGSGGRTVTVNTPAGSPTINFRVLGATLTISAPSPSLVTGSPSAHSGTVTVSNTATGASAGPFTFSSAPAVNQTGAVHGSFAITGGSCANGLVVNAGSNCTIIVQYTPSLANTLNSTAHVTVIGTGITGTLPAANSPATQNGNSFNAN